MKVFGLLNRFQQSGVKLEEFDVVVALGERRSTTGLPSQITPMTLNLLADPRYAFGVRHHFFVLQKMTGVVFDVDILDAQTPHISEFARLMFGRPNEAPDIRVKRLGAKQFVDLIESSRVQTVQEFFPILQRLREPTLEWPETSLDDVVRSFK